MLRDHQLNAARQGFLAFRRGNDLDTTLFQFGDHTVRLSRTAQAVEFIDKDAGNESGFGILDQLEQLQTPADCTACAGTIHVINARPATDASASILESSLLTDEERQKMRERLKENLRQ